MSAAAGHARAAPWRGGPWVALAVVGIVVYALRYALLPFVVAAAVAFVVDPPIRALQRRGLPRAAASAAVYVPLVLAVGAAGYWGGRTALYAVAHVVARAPALLRRAAEEFLGPQGIRLLGRTWTPDDIAARVLDAVGGAVGGAGFLGLTAAGVATLFGVVLVFVLIPYFMISGPRLVAGAVWLLPVAWRPAVQRALGEVTPMLRRYVIGIAVVVTFTSTVAWLGFGPLFHLPHAVLLAVVVGLLELIPVAGPILSGMIVAVTVIQQHSPWAAAGLAAFAIALRLVIDNVVGPIVLGTAGRIHPVVVIFSFVCGATLFGILGLLLAVPIAATIRIVAGQREAAGRG
jgi:predicted PurR-regulated permease PerM